MSGVILSGLLAGYGVAIPVGAIGALIVSLASRHSWRVGAAAAMGVATADGIYAVIAVLGGAALADVIRPISGALKWVAFAILLVLAGKTAWDAVRHRKERATPRATGGRRAFWTLLGLTLLNPVTIVYFGSLVLGRRADDGLSAGADALWVAAAFVASASWQLFLAASGSLLGRVLTGTRGRFWSAMVSSAVIGVLAVLLVIPGA